MRISGPVAYILLYAALYAAFGEPKPAPGPFALLKCQSVPRHDFKKFGVNPAAAARLTTALWTAERTDARLSLTGAP